MSSRQGCSVLVAYLCAAATLAAQHMPDRSFRPMIEDRAYAIGTGPVVCVDASHGNAYTITNGFWPFADLVRRDGYVVRPLTAFDQRSHDGCRILVIAAPRSPVEQGQFLQWVADGGSLLLVVDRGSSAALSELAAAFDVGFLDSPEAAGRFRTADQTLRPHAVVRGRHAQESASSVTVFAALAMRVPPIAEPLLVTADRAVLAAVMRVDQGRAAFIGDPALLTAQIAAPDRRLIGMNAPGADHNFRFVLNLLHWLSGVI